MECYFSALLYKKQLIHRQRCVCKRFLYMHKWLVSLKSDNGCHKFLLLLLPEDKKSFPQIFTLFLHHHGMPVTVYFCRGHLSVEKIAEMWIHAFLRSLVLSVQKQPQLKFKLSLPILFSIQWNPTTKNVSK